MDQRAVARAVEAEPELCGVRRALGQRPAGPAGPRTTADAKAETSRIRVQCREGVPPNGPVLVGPRVLAAVPAVDRGACAGAREVCRRAVTLDDGAPIGQVLDEKEKRREVSANSTLGTPPPFTLQPTLTPAPFTAA